MASSPDLQALLWQLSQLPDDSVRHSPLFQSLRDAGDSIASDLLSALASNADVAARKSLSLFEAFLTYLNWRWPAIDAIRCQVLLVSRLPEAAKTGRDVEAAQLTKKTKDLAQGCYQSLADFIPVNNRAALRSSSGDGISFASLHEFVERFRLPVDTTSPRKPVITVALPNGPLLAAALLAVSTYYTAAPINPAVGDDQFVADVQLSGSRCILTTPSYYEKLKMRLHWGRGEMDVYFVELNGEYLIRVTDTTEQELQMATVPACRPNGPRDIGLVLFTSGTSGTKKVVPLTVHSIACGAALVISSWALTPNDVCLNMMPLYHV